MANRITRTQNESLHNRIESAQVRLYHKLVHADIESPNVSEYGRRYLEEKIASLKGVLQLYGRLLHLCLSNSRILLEDFVLVDYGGGSGLISFLAKEMGVGTVIYCDIYDVSCEDAKLLSAALGLTMNHVVCGDVDELISYLQKNRLCINAVTSYDVIEHIYDVESHFRKLASLSDCNFRVVYGSTANIENPIYVRGVKKTQIEVEHKTRERVWGHKERDSLQAYVDMRRDMISAYAPDLSSEIIEQLAFSTRGLMQRDIEKCVDEFRRRGNITYHIDHPTNTCDPNTGNWCEHLMDFDWLERILKNQGFSVRIMTGRYNSFGSLIKKSVKAGLNATIRLLGQRGMIVAPYYVVCADFTRQDSVFDAASAMSQYPE